MKLKIVIVSLMLTTMVLSICSCTKSNENETKAVESKTIESKIVEETPTEAAIESQDDNSDMGEKENALIHFTCNTVREGRKIGNNIEDNVYIKYPQFSLNDNDAKEYPCLAKALNNLNGQYASEYAKHLDYSQEIAEVAVADGTDMTINFYDYLTPEIRRADNHIVSMLEIYETYTGGVHGYNAFYGDNIDPLTGKELFLQDVIIDMDTFKNTIKEKLYEKYPGETFDNLDEALKDLEPIEGDVAIWTMDYSGITLYFNPYHLTSYAGGMQVITVPFNEAPDVFVDNYLDIPDAYVQKLNAKAPAILDVNDDGINEAVFVIEEIPEWEVDEAGYKDWVVYCGDDTVRVSNCSYYGQFYLVYSNNQYYVHIFDVGDSDYSLFSVVDLKSMKYDEEKRFNASFRLLDSIYDSYDKGYHAEDTEDVYTDPKCVYLSSRIETLGSNTGIKLYCIGNDGCLYSKDEYFDVHSYMVYTAKRDMECTLVDQNGKQKDEGSIKEGKYYHLIRTDNKTFADLQELNEGEVVKNDEYPYIWLEEPKGIDISKPIYRLKVDISEYPHTIDGIPEEEVLDGILYAG